MTSTVIYSVPYIDNVIIKCLKPLNVLSKAMFVWYTIDSIIRNYIFVHGICAMTSTAIYTVSIISTMS